MVVFFIFFPLFKSFSAIQVIIPSFLSYCQYTRKTNIHPKRVDICRFFRLVKFLHIVFAVVFVVVFVVIFVLVVFVVVLVVVFVLVVFKFVHYKCLLNFFTRIFPCSFIFLPLNFFIPLFAVFY
jgi:hypothetical protein